MNVKGYLLTSLIDLDISMYLCTYIFNFISNEISVNCFPLHPVLLFPWGQRCAFCLPVYTSVCPAQRSYQADLWEWSLGEVNWIELL